MLRYAVLLALFSAAFACEAFPNNTQATFNWWQCYEGPIKFYNGTPEDAAGNYEYPIKLNSPLLIKGYIDNEGHVYNDVTIDIRLWEWDNVFGCRWDEINTFGLLNNMPGCKNGIPCPIKMGKQWIILKLDFSKFGAIIGLLKNNAAYQIQLTMKDKASSDKTCIVAQGRALTH